MTAERYLAAAARVGNKILRWTGDSRRLVAPTPCRHQNYRERRWVQDNAPFVHFVCLDCGYEDRGHVHGDTIDWATDGWETHVKGDNAGPQG
jgi:hypothetical protein